MKKIAYLIFILSIFSIFSLNVHASSIVSVNGNQVRFRSAPTTSNSTVYNMFDIGVELIYLETSSILKINT